MSNSIRHSGRLPEAIYTVVESDSGVFWIYLKEGHAINRMLGLREKGIKAEIVRFCPEKLNDNS
jgi:hypothetical protein